MANKHQVSSKLFADCSSPCTPQSYHSIALVNAHAPCEARKEGTHGGTTVHRAAASDGGVAVHTLSAYGPCCR
eukprot:1158687-Pelagomonas_calceolata.AAC.6